jgi:hypothetical protein
VSTCFLIRADALQMATTNFKTNNESSNDLDYIMSSALTFNDIEIFVSNRVEFGYLVSPGKMACSSLFCIKMHDSF